MASEEEERRRERCHSPYLVSVSEETERKVKQVSPSAERNTAPILEVLRDVLPAGGDALEVASGCGQHSFAFAKSFPGFTWQPSDQDPTAISSIEAWRADSGLENFCPPIRLDLQGANWEKRLGRSFDAIIAINLLHISPWEVTCALFSGASRLLTAAGFVFVYGCFKKDGQHISESNVEFDESLRARNPNWGVRDIGEVEAEALRSGLVLERAVAMPANNYALVLRRS